MFKSQGPKANTDHHNNKKKPSKPLLLFNENLCGCMTEMKSN